MLKSNLLIQKKTLLAWLTLALGLAITLYVSIVTKSTIEQKAIEQFAFTADQLTFKVEEQLEEYALVLKGAAAFFRASDKVERHDWKEYVEALSLEKHFPGNLGLGFNQRIHPDALDKHIEAIRAEGFPHYTIRPADKREMYTSVVYIEPFSGQNFNAFGYDTYSEPTRRAAMQRACDTAEPAITAKLELVQDEQLKRVASTIMYAPVYQKGMPTSTVHERQEAIIGWTSGPYRMSGLIDGVLIKWQGHDTKAINLQIYDGIGLHPNNILYSNNDTFDKKLSFLQQKRTITFNGHHWTLLFDLSHPEQAITYGYVWLTIAVGIVFSLLMFVILLSIINTQTNAEKIAQKLTVKIKESERLLKESEFRWKFAIEGSRDGVWDWNIQTNESLYTKRWKEILGYSESDIMPSHTEWEERVHPDDKRELQYVLEAYFQGNSPVYEAEFRMRCKDDTYKWILSRGIVVYWSDEGKPLRMIGTHTDITERKQTEEMLRKLSTAVEQSPTSIVMTNLDAEIEYVNPQFTRITGYTLDEVKHQNPRMLQSGEMPKETYLELWDTLVRGETWSGELLNKRKNGEHYWEEAHIAPVKNIHGVVTHYIATKSDITERKMMEDKIHHLAFYDALTQLPNRRLLNERLASAMSSSKRHGTYYALLFLDLDNFKPLNDANGHTLGDLLLIEVAKRLKKSIREIDTVARFGGDEFVIILTDLGEKKAEAYRKASSVAKKLHTHLEKPYQLAIDGTSQPLHYQCTASIGVILFFNHDGSKEVLLERADKAMYQAKANGRNQIYMDKGTDT